MGRLVFITSGARSGKSSFALRKASLKGARRLFAATLEPQDEEMKKRVALHRAQRGEGWETREVPLEIAGLLGEVSGQYDVVVVDCLTLWLSNVVHSQRSADEEIDRLVGSMAEAKSSMHVYVVSNEVGMGIVPENELARSFRDLAGVLNQKVAEVADEVYLMAAGIPVKIK